MDDKDSSKAENTNNETESDNLNSPPQSDETQQEQKNPATQDEPSPDTPQPTTPPETPAQTNEVTSDNTAVKKQAPWKFIAAIAAAILLVLVGFLLLSLNNDETAEETVAIKNPIAQLRVSVQDGPLNNFYQDVTNDAATFVNYQIYEGLVTYEDINQIRPLLATSWTNPDDETWLFTLKQGVTFHNGETMTAEDVVYSIEQRANVAKGDVAPQIESVEAIDEQTVQIKTDGPAPLLLSELVLVYIVDETEAAAGAIPVGTGPYILAPEVEQTPTKVEVSAFDNYHGGEVYTKSVVFEQLSNEDAVKKFNDGEIDIVTALVSDYEDLDESAETLSTNDFAVAFLALFAKEDSALADPLVREAIRIAVDKESVIEAQNVIGQAASQYVTRDIPGFNPTITGLTVNQQEARDLLTQAGYEDGLTLELSYATDNNQGMFTSIRDQLAEVGITVTEDFYGDDAESFFGKLFGPDAEMAFIAYAPDILDASDTYGALFGSEGIITNTVSDEVQTLLDEAANIIDETERIEKLQQIATLLDENHVSVPLYSRDAITGLRGPYVIERDLPSGSIGVKFFKVHQ